jgi:tetratricopeptide (TPR) repeat protein
MIASLKIALGLFLTASAFALGAETPAALEAKGDALDKQLRTREALAVYLEAEKAGPPDSEVLRKIAKQYAESMAGTASKAEKRKLGEQALDYAKRSVAADARNPKALLSLAICYGRLAPLMENRTKIEYSRLVKEYVDRTLKLDPSDDYAWHVLGAWNYELANLNPVLRGLAGLIYGTLPSASNEKAVECFRKSVELAPQRVSHHIELGRTYAALGQKQLARDAIERGLSLPSREKDDEDTKQRGRTALQRL